jgi:hypothetical protein
VNGVIDYYEKPPLDYRKSPSAGFFCRVPIPFALEGNTAIRLSLERENKDNPADSQYLLDRTDLTSYDPTKDKSLRPIGLKKDEFAIVLPHKNRPCILLSDPITEGNFPAPGNQGFLVVPLYSVYDENGDYKKSINRETVLRAQAYQLNHVFYLPESEEFGIQESFARLDRVIFASIPLIFPTPPKLTSIATALLRQWSWHYQGFPFLDKPLVEFMEAQSATLDERLKVTK